MPCLGRTIQTIILTLKIVDKMILRRKVLPKSVQDALVTLFTVLIIPLVYWFELFVVLPTFYEIWGCAYMFHFVMGTYILINVASNYVAIILCDTSIKGRIFPSTIASNWHFCSVCESLVPPRSWHCNVCNICILKRDHHCMFTSCCVGHHNQRYFLMFIFYIFVAALYATYFNTFFIWARVDFRSTTFIKFLFPLAMLFVEQSYNQTYLFLYIIILIACVFTAVLLYYHTNLMLNGVVTHERNHKLNEYDLGKMQNVKAVLGDVWYLVWLSPFLISKLPSDGINFITKNSLKSK